MGILDLASRSCHAQSSVLPCRSGDGRSSFANSSLLRGVSRAWRYMSDLFAASGSLSLSELRLAVRPRSRVLMCAFFSAAFLAGCAQEAPQTQGGVWRKTNTNEYFAQGKKYGKASPRVVRNGRHVPKGGGRYIVGKPYKIAGKRYFPREYRAGHTQVGRASWYGDAFHGRKTANGEIYDMSSITAAHPTMPLPSYARVTNRKNGRSIIVRVNDRGPFHGGRVMDLSKRVADLLDFRRAGTAVIKVEYLRPASTAGSDDRQLLASLRTDGSPADLDGNSGPGRTLIARPAPSEPAPRRAPEPARAGPVIVTNGRPEPTVSHVARSPLAGSPAQTSAPADPDPTLVSAELPANAPIPVERPFDLATIPGAATPIAASRAAPSRASAPTNVARVTFFAPYSSGGALARRFEKRGPFQGMDLNRLRTRKDHP